MSLTASSTVAEIIQEIIDTVGYAYDSGSDALAARREIALELLLLLPQSSTEDAVSIGYNRTWAGEELRRVKSWRTAASTRGRGRLFDLSGYRSIG